MRRKRNKKLLLTEGVYDFYNSQEGGPDDKTIDKILNYYIDKIMKHGQGSLTKTENQILNDAKSGKLSLDNPIYKRNKLTGDIETNDKGEAVRLDKEHEIPGVPFITSKGKGKKKKEVINARCYWNVDDDDCKVYYVFSVARIDDDNSTGLVIYKTESKSGSELGAFIKPRTDLKNKQPEDVWTSVNDKYDKGIVLDKEIYLKFLNFDKLFHTSRKSNIVELTKLHRDLENYPD